MQDDYFKDSSSDEGCNHVCGGLPAAPAGAATFTQRLSPQCAAVLGAARANNATRLGMRPGVRAAKKRDCAAHVSSARATNPVVVHRAGALPFVMGTVPKAGCTNLRKLLLVLIGYHPRKKAPEGGFRVPLSMELIHWNAYPTVWHYAQQDGVLEQGRLPSFLVSRNPYQRLVSSYLVRISDAIWHRSALSVGPVVPSCSRPCQALA